LIAESNQRVKEDERAKLKSYINKRPYAEMELRLIAWKVVLKGV
jgi:hypothetical protein